MTKEKKLDESRPGPRLLVLMGLLFTGEDAGLLSLEALRTSPVSMAYAIALATAALATLVAMRRDGRGEAAREPKAPRTGPVWHESTLFTDPWYQFPAVFCVFILYSRFVLDLIVEPPSTDRAVWFLAGLGVAILALAFGLTGAADSEKRQTSKEAARADEAGGEPERDENESPVGAALRDPWFSVPATSIAFLHAGRAGVEKIEEDPGSLWATVWLLVPVAGVMLGVVSTAISRARRKRKDAIVG